MHCKCQPQGLVQRIQSSTIFFSNEQFENMIIPISNIEAGVNININTITSNRYIVGKRYILRRNGVQTMILLSIQSYTVYTIEISEYSLISSDVPANLAIKKPVFMLPIINRNKR